MAELRKLRKREDMYIEAMREITNAIAGIGNEDVYDAMQQIEDAIDKCKEAIEGINEREEFLQKLETPKNQTDADEILKKIRARANK